MNKNTEIKKYVENYLDKGWSPIPVNITTVWDNNAKEVKKKPIFPKEWKKYQTEFVKKDKIDLEWFGFNGIAIATGKLSGITVVDIDIKDKGIVPIEMFETYVVETNNGYHLYYSYNAEAKQSQEKVKNIDIRNDGGLIFAPPTVYKMPDDSDASYKVINDRELAEFPIEWYGKTFKQEKNNWKDKIISPIESGSRNMDFTSIVGGLLNKFPQDDWEKIVWKLVKDENKVQELPLEEDELRSVFNSISNRELQ